MNSVLALAVTLSAAFCSPLAASPRQRNDNLRILMYIIIGAWLLSRGRSDKTDEKKTEHSRSSPADQTPRPGNQYNAVSTYVAHAPRVTWPQAVRSGRHRLAHLISLSKVQTYRRCPHCYRLIYIDGFHPHIPRRVYARGERFHMGVARYFRRRIGQRIQRINAAALRREIRKAYASPLSSSTEAWLEKACIFVARQFPRGPTVRAVEKRIYWHANGLTFAGRLDLLLQHPDGKMEILDFKTDAKPANIKKHLEQLVYYACLLSNSTPRRITLRLMYVTAEKVISREVQPHEIARVQTGLLQTGKAISSDVSFLPRPGPHCKSCGVRKHCIYAHTG